MVATPDFIGFSQLSPDGVAVIDRRVVSTFVAHLSVVLRVQALSMIPEDTSSSPALTSQNFQLQLSHFLFPETVGVLTQFPYDVPPGTTQDPHLPSYLPLQNTLDSSNVPPQTIIAPFDDSVRNCIFYPSPTPPCSKFLV